MSIHAVGFRPLSSNSMVAFAGGKPKKPTDQEFMRAFGRNLRAYGVKPRQYQWDIQPLPKGSQLKTFMLVLKDEDALLKTKAMLADAFTHYMTGGQRKVEPEKLRGFQYIDFYTEQGMEGAHIILINPKPKRVGFDGWSAHCDVKLDDTITLHDKANEKYKAIKWNLGPYLAEEGLCERLGVPFRYG